MSVSLPPPRDKPDSQTEALAIQRQIHDLVERHFALKHASKPFLPGDTPVPVSGRCFDASDVKALVDSALDFWLTAGPYNEQFQTNLAKRIGVRYALTVNSGSSANLVAFSALTSPLLRERQVPAGSEVITAAAGFPTTVNPAMMCGMTPVFGDVGTLSFYPAHHITMGEGGAAFTGNPVLRRAMETFRDWGRDCYCDPGKDNTCNRRFGWQLGDLPYGYDHKYIYSHLGYNLKITDMQAAVGVSQLDHLDAFVAARRRNFDILKKGLRDLEEFFVLPEATPNSEPSWFGFLLTVRQTAPFGRDEIMRHLNDCQIGTRLLFGGNLTRQPYMQGRNYRVHGSLKNSDRIMNDTFWIGVFPGLGESELGYVVGVIHDFCRAHAAAGVGRASR